LLSDVSLFAAECICLKSKFNGRDSKDFISLYEKLEKSIPVTHGTGDPNITICGLLLM
jgi:hypothetical protein